MKNRIITSLTLASALTTGLVGISSRASAATLGPQCGPGSSITSTSGVCVQTAAFPVGALTTLQGTSFTNQALVPDIKKLLDVVNLASGEAISLNNVQAELAGKIVSNYAVENRDLTLPQKFSVIRSGSVVLTIPSVTTTPFVVSFKNDPAVDGETSLNTFNATKFDGTLDFGGTSGYTFAPFVYQKDTGPISITGPDQTVFYGTGTIGGKITATGTSTIAPTGLDGATLYGGQAGGLVTITYDFSITPPRNPETVPEPSAVIGLLAFAGLGLKRLAKNNQK